MHHTFHIPVLGLAYSIDTPLKVAQYGISSVVSIVDDQAIERAREYHTLKENLTYTPIYENEFDFRAKRITAYLNLMNAVVKYQFKNIQLQSFENGKELNRYFNLLPKHCSLKNTYETMLETQDPTLKATLQQQLKAQMQVSAIDVNIMSKVDKINYKNNQALADDFSDALAALRGFAQSDLESSLVLSAGMNPKLYAYLEKFPDFFPNQQQQLKKKVILKVSDFRSAFIQAKFLAKKGIWISEFRIESGLNCGGHAFATEGFLIGPILEEFKSKRTEMQIELFDMYQAALIGKGLKIENTPSLKVTFQGGIGTAEEQSFLLNYYQLDATGWGSPFLLVPEVSNVDDKTLQDLAQADASDFYISNASPLGIPFNNFKKSGAEQQRLQRIQKGIPGSPCTKKYLVSNTEFTSEPICLASRKYQKLKLNALQNSNLPTDVLARAVENVTDKICLCEGLVTSFYKKINQLKAKENTEVAICPGPNLAYFNKVYSLDEMIKHIYGEINLLESINRSAIFINELKLYIDYLSKDVTASLFEMTDKKRKSLLNFKQQLFNGINYYRELFPSMQPFKESFKQRLLLELDELELKLKSFNQVLLG